MQLLKIFNPTVRTEIASLPRRLVLTWLVLGVLGLLLLVWVVSALVSPQPVLISPQTDQQLSLGSRLEIRFSLPVARRTLTYDLTPDVSGTWHWQGGAFGGKLARTLVFEPDEPWAENTAYTVKLAGIVGAFGAGTAQTADLKFQTAMAPVIVGASFIDNQQLEPTADIIVGLDQPNDQLAEFSFRLEPPGELEVELSENKDAYRLKPKTTLARGQTYTLIAEREVLSFSKLSGAVTQRSAKTEVLRQAFVVKPAPNITHFSPQGLDLLPSQDKIKVVFSEAMNKESVVANFLLSPLAQGSLAWLSDSELEYRFSESLAKATTYTGTFNKGTLTASGDQLTEAVTFSFTTIGAVKVSNFQPGSGALVSASISVTFNQPVDQASAQANFSLNPSTAGSFAWKSNTLVFTPTTPFDYYQSYTISLSPGVKSLYGLDSTQVFTHKFTTQEKIVLLNVAWDRQDHALSCEVASLKMALKYKGVSVSEAELLGALGYDLSPRIDNIWGDPDETFVGDVDGAQNTTGYGVHWGPIARIAAYWRPAKAVSGLSTVQLAQELEAGNPVVVWGVTGKSYYDPWTTASGKTVHGWKGEHARTAIGFKGSASNPTSIILLDPLAGKITWSRAAFEQNWATFNNGAAIIY